MDLPKNNCSFCKHLSLEGPNTNFEYDVRCILRDECPSEICLCEYFEKEHSSISALDLDIAYDNFLDLALRMNFEEYTKTNYYNLLKQKSIAIHNNECSICNNSEDLNLIHLNHDNIGRESFDDTTLICNNCYNALLNNKDCIAHTTKE